MNAISYWFMRCVIISIAWLEIRGKINRITKLKSGVPLWDRITMQYLSAYVTRHQKELRFWFVVKRGFTAVEISLTVLYGVLAFLGFLPDASAAICRIILIQSGIIAAIMCFQFDIERNTKYDRMRIRKQK